jgi:hypothetical protein
LSSPHEEGGVIELRRPDEVRGVVGGVVGGIVGWGDDGDDGGYLKVHRREVDDGVVGGDDRLDEVWDVGGIVGGVIGGIVRQVVGEIVGGIFDGVVPGDSGDVDRIVGCVVHGVGETSHRECESARGGAR